MMTRQRSIRERLPLLALAAALIFSAGLFSCASVPEGNGANEGGYSSEESLEPQDVGDSEGEAYAGLVRIIVKNDTPYPIWYISDARGAEYFFDEELASGASVIIVVESGSTTLTAEVSLPSGVRYVPQAANFEADGTYHWDISEGPWVPAAIETAYGYLAGYSYLSDYGYLSAYEYMNAYDYLMN
jgi:hypothetical protein